MLKWKENFKCYGINTRPAKHRRVLYSYKKIVFKIYLLEFRTKLVQKPASFVPYSGKMWRRQSTTEILERKENFKRSDIKNKIYKKPVSASQLSKIVFKI